MPSHWPSGLKATQERPGMTFEMSPVAVSQTFTCS